MEIKQFYDKPLAHASYALVSQGEMAVVDPGRDPQIYYDFAEKNNSKITTVIETHPHADFVSSHLQIAREKGATIYVSEKVGADYPHTTFDEGQEIKIGNTSLKAINTPGHSPDSITVIATDEKGNKAAFTGDTLFIGDVGRPDLREKAGKMKAKREELAESMYHSIHDKLSKLSDDTMVYPAHGAGSLCGKNMSSETSSDIKTQKEENWAFKTTDKQDFISTILDDQPFIPKYFSYDVDLNKKGAQPYEESIGAAKNTVNWNAITKDSLVIDCRNEKSYKKAHLGNSINIMLTETSKFETWLGAIIAPGEPYYLVAENESQLEHATQRAAKIGYETFIKGQAESADNMPRKISPLDLDHFKNNQGEYTIIDIRNKGEVAEGKFFDYAIDIPLHELRERAGEIPTDKPIVVHCAGGFRSAAGSSIVKNELEETEVFDLGEAVKEFQ